MAVKGSLSYLKSVKRQIEKDVAEMELLISEVEGIIPLYSKKQKEFILKVIQDPKKMDIEELRRRSKDMKNSLENQTKKRKEILEQLELYSFLKEEYKEISELDIVDYGKEIQEKIESYNKEEQKRHDLENDEKEINQHPAVTEKIEGLPVYKNKKEAMKSLLSWDFSDLFENGEDEYQDEATAFLYINDRFFKAVLTGEVNKVKTDHKEFYQLDKIVGAKLSSFTHEEYRKKKDAELQEEIKKQEEILAKLKNKKV